MTRFIVAAAALGLCAGTAALAVPSAPGDFNGFDTQNSPMTDQGGGIWTYDVTGAGAGARQEFNLIADPAAGNNGWDSQYYGTNQWAYADGAGEYTITLDTNFYNDGWFPQENRISTSTAPLQSWAATGDWVDDVGAGFDWDLGSAPAMTETGVGTGVFTYNNPNFPVGTWNYKPIANGSWDSVGGDNTTSVNASNFLFDVLPGFQDVTLWVDANNGTVRVTAVPAPGVAALAGLGGLAATRRRRR